MPHIAVPSVKLPRLVRSLWIKLSLTAIALLLVFLGFQHSYRPAGYKHPAQHVTASKQHSKTQPQNPQSSSTNQTTEVSAAATTPTASTPSSHPRPNTAPSGSLSISPSPVVIYKVVSPNPYLKTPATLPTKHIDIAATDGVHIRNLSIGAPANVIWYPPEMPFGTSLPAEVNASTLAPGTYDYHAIAQVASGATYTGTIELIVKPVPMFTVYAPQPLVASGSASSDDVKLSGFEWLQFDLSQVADFMPTMTITVNGLSCRSSLTSTADPACDSALDSLPAGFYAGSLIFENQFQVITLPLNVNIAP